MANSSEPSANYNSRLAITAILIAVIAMAGYVVYRHEHTTTLASAAPADSAVSNGDVAAAPPSAPIDSLLANPQARSLPKPPPPDSLAPAAPTPYAGYPAYSAYPSYPTPPAIPPSDTALGADGRQRTVQGRLHEPPIGTMPGLTLPRKPMMDDSALTHARPDSVVATSDPCASPLDSDQRSCLRDAVSRADAGVSRLLDQVVAAYRRQANAQPGDPDPASVTQLRDAERRWFDDREAACRDAGSAPLYARDRGQCYADMAAQRTKILRQLLESAPPPGL